MQSSVTTARRVLVVDDDQAVADTLVLLLQCLGADARVAYSGMTALAMVPEFSPDLVLVDIGMPGMDGCETAHRIRRLPQGKDLVVAAVSAWSLDDLRRRRYADAFDHQLVKPVPVEVLEKLLGLSFIEA